MPRPGPEGLPVLEGAFSTLPPLPPLRLLPLLPPRLPVDLGIFLPPFLWIFIASGGPYKFPIEAIMFHLLCRNDIAIYPDIDLYYSISQLLRPSPVAVVIFLPRSVQLSSAGTHSTCLIDLYFERQQMGLTKPPKRFK